MRGEHVSEAVGEMLRVLGPHTGGDWGRPAGGLEWTCWETAAHVAHDLTAYAGQLAGLPGDAYLPLDLQVRAGTPPASVLRVVAACGRLLRIALDAAAPEDRAWHWGPTDATGFAALGVNETLVHTYDIAAGLGVPWMPPDRLAAAVLARLFPGAPAGAGTPGETLLWCTGRIDLPGRERVTSWVLKAARPSEG